MVYCIVLLRFQYSLQFIFIALTSFTSHSTIYIAFSLSLRHAVVIITTCNHGLSVTSIAFRFPLPLVLMKTYCRLSCLKHLCCFQNFATVQQTLLKSVKMSITVLNFRNKRLSGNTSMETNACYRDVESCRYRNVKSHLFSLIISTNMLLHKVHILHLPFPLSYTLW